ncbi:MAG: 3-deoxy-manno-octulosonate cytidylyltransferase [Peptococcaceae bacterium]|jgi:3-deoxy-manno-octulosonate cytidylyltransferase (CMP-KDO synthetase)|nr:3-deoxy-manno-octulosonate cytidylyltransferase [Peptococcaceae bacterium]
MKTIAVIPARYESSRIPGKPLADICGKPMLWRVYQQTIKAKGLSDVICAVDDDRVMAVCRQYGLNAVMTSDKHPKHVDRVHEVSDKIKADFYAVVCGDEPLVEPESIEAIIPPGDSWLEHEYVVRSLMRDFDDPVEAYDSASMKCAVNAEGRCVFISRSMIPLPYKTVDFTLKRLVGIECYNKNALDFFVNTPAGALEQIEDITLLRYLEYFVPVHLVNTTVRQIGVDTPKNLEMVRAMIKEKIEAGVLA